MARGTAASEGPGAAIDTKRTCALPTQARRAGPGLCRFGVRASGAFAEQRVSYQEQRRHLREPSEREENVAAGLDARADDAPQEAPYPRS